MSHIIYDFLANTELFSEKFLNGNEDNFNSLIPILQDYRDHCVNNYQSVGDEILSDAHQGIRTIEHPFGQLHKKLSQDKILAQSILQDLIIIPDPLFSFCAGLQNRDDNATHAKFLGMQPSNDSELLRALCRYMKDMTPFIVFNVVKFYPDLTKLQSKGLPIYYSPTGFAEYFDKDVMQWFQSKVKVHGMTKSDDGFIIEINKPLEPCRSIFIEFDGSDGQCTNTYNLFEQRILDFDEKTRKSKIVITLPTVPPAKEFFDHWVFQSVNQSARAFLGKAKKDAFYAHTFNARFSPQNNFVQDLVTKTFTVDERVIAVEENSVSPVTFNLEVPTSLNATDFLKIRSDTSSLFSFRTYLNQKLKELSSLKDPKEVQLQSRDIMDELNRKYLPDFKIALSNTYQKEILKWTALAASMGVGVFAQQNHLASGLVGLGLAASGLHTTKDNIDKLKAMPGYFWSRISKK